MWVSGKALGPVSVPGGERQGQGVSGALGGFCSLQGRCPATECTWFSPPGGADEPSLHLESRGVDALCLLGCIPDTWETSRILKCGFLYFTPRQPGMEQGPEIPRGLRASAVPRLPGPTPFHGELRISPELVTPCLATLERGPGSTPLLLRVLGCCHPWGGGGWWRWVQLSLGSSRRGAPTGARPGPLLPSPGPGTQLALCPLGRR